MKAEIIELLNIRVTRYGNALFTVFYNEQGKLLASFFGNESFLPLKNTEWEHIIPLFEHYVI